MSDSGKDRWNSLLETLGVPAREPAPPPARETPAEEATAPAKQQPISMLRPEKQKAAAKPKPAKAAPKSPSYWSRIAGVLGLESAAESAPVVEPAEQPQPEAPAAEVAEPSVARHEEPRRSRRSREEESPRRGFDRPRREEPRREEPRREEPRREEPRREEPRREEPRREESRREESRREEREEAAESSRQSLSEILGKKDPDVNVFGLGIRDEDGETRTDLPEELPRGQDARIKIDSGAVLDYDRPEESDLAFDPPPAADSGFRDEESEDREGRRRRRRRGRGRGRGRVAERPPHAAERHESDIEPAGEDADFDIDRDEELDLDIDLGDLPVSRQREPRGGENPREFESPELAPRGERQPRRREEQDSDEPDDDRRGGRSRRKRGERAESGRHERDATRPPRESRHAARPVPPTDDEPDEDLHDAASGDDDPGDSGSPTHKRIPTWEEAVNVLIDANMAVRASSPDRGDRGRGRGRGRGR